MTDYFFPPPQAPGSNAIGSFTIGVSPIGTINALLWQKTVISQYANSPRILQLLSNFDAYLDQSENMDEFFDKMWNIDTAEGYGLDVWGRILGVGRALDVGTNSYLGFEEALPGSQTFGSGILYAGAPVTTNYDLVDDAYRILLLAKALANICEGSIPAINQLLMNLFPGRGNAYVQEGVGSSDVYLGFTEAGSVNAAGFNQAPFYAGETLMHMSMQYVFEFPLTPVEMAIVEQSGVLPTPCGVSATIVIL